MANEQQEHIKKIRDDFQASQRIKDSFNNSIQALAKDLYSKDTHFIFELIQNAEDNEYKDLEPSLSFRLSKTDPTGTRGADGALIIQNNEIGFSSDNVDAICAVGKTTKSKIQGYIGEKGIGFKSVFRITTNPHIFSNGYRFCLPEYDEETGLGYIVLFRFRRNWNFPSFELTTSNGGTPYAEEAQQLQCPGESGDSQAAPA